MPSSRSSGASQLNKTKTLERLDLAPTLERGSQVTLERGIQNTTSSTSTHHHQPPRIADSSSMFRCLIAYHTSRSSPMLMMTWVRGLNALPH